MFGYESGATSKMASPFVNNLTQNGRLLNRQAEQAWNWLFTRACQQLPVAVRIAIGKFAGRSALPIRSSWKCSKMVIISLYSSGLADPGRQPLLRWQETGGQNLGRSGDGQRGGRHAC